MDTDKLYGDAETLQSGATFIVYLVCVVSVIAGLLLSGSCIYFIWKDRKTARKRKKENAEKANDMEVGDRLELGGEANGGLCELEQPGLPELNGNGIVELWDESCANEADGRQLAVELDGKA
ncbi:hypothetical protein CC80DRAFT_556517 [Byssothecium circinans]|uniref:Uncharacterized protein n=1 Tax=Byssothecium circinans TaxID=147558 RepID=A0A6A5T5M8_9PLEO|nr:hypothetical protein CC80DRAFT_556517 [Byssothecium circinans]